MRVSGLQPFIFLRNVTAAMALLRTAALSDTHCTVQVLIMLSHLTL